MRRPETGGIPKAAREGAATEAGDVVELGESRERAVADLANAFETAARTAMASAIRRGGAAADSAARIQEVAARIVREAGPRSAVIVGAVNAVVGGAIDASHDAGLDELEAAEAAAFGALEAAADVGEAAVEQVKGVVTQTFHGVRPVDESVFARGRRTP